VLLLQNAIATGLAQNIALKVQAFVSVNGHILVKIVVYAIKVTLKILELEDACQQINAKITEVLRIVKVMVYVCKKVI
jgi:hypothetical protein